jgi:hypothetical protein
MLRDLGDAYVKYFTKCRLSGFPKLLSIGKQYARAGCETVGVRI